MVVKPKIIIVLVSFILLVIGGCKKEAGPGEKNIISGTVLYKNGVTGNNDVAPMATVYIAYGTSEATATFDQAILTDTEGRYSVGGFNKGNYFIKASFKDIHGFNYTTPGYSIALKNKKNNVEVNITLE